MKRLLYALCFTTVTTAYAAELIVTVAGISAEKGDIGCALFSEPQGFPMDSSKSRNRWQKAKPGTVECRYENLPPGTYAIAISHDTNGNRRTDTNFVGMPKEDWGVSNNARPKMRAPKFEEAKFEVKDGAPTRIEVRLGR